MYLTEVRFPFLQLLVNDFYQLYFYYEENYY
jgi:hypothetical protein